MSNPVTHKFTLVLADSPEIDDHFENALFEAGCDDALLGSRNGVTYLDFDRVANTLRDAIESAVCDVQAAGYQVARVEPDDLASAAEIARRMERSRESIRLLVRGVRGPGGFPPPVSGITQSSPLWRWSEVVQWFSNIESCDIPAAADSQTIRRINALLEMRNADAHVLQGTAIWNAIAKGTTGMGTTGVGSVGTTGVGSVGTTGVGECRKAAAMKKYTALTGARAQTKGESKRVRSSGTTRHK